MKISCIYEVTCTINNKKYIGQTTDFEERKKSHIRHSKKENPIYLISEKIKEHGEENFVWKILELCTPDRKTLNSLEKLWIKKENSLFPNGYNITKGGNGWWWKNKEISSKKLSKALKKSWESKSVEDRKLIGLKISKSLSGKKLSVTHIKSLVDSHKGKVRNDLKGEKFGELTVISLSKTYDSGNPMWDCVCSCGNKKSIAGKHLLQGTKSCGCLKTEKIIKKGTIYNYLKVLNDSYIKNKSRYYLCECVCGTKKYVFGARLKSGRIKSCGCKKNERSKRIRW